MKVIAEWSVIALTTLTTLLIFSMVLVEFDTLDTTILAGIIAFVGAIIGGFLTLFGVRETIKSNNEIESNKITAKQYQASLRVISMFVNATNTVSIEYNDSDSSYTELLEKLIKELNRDDGIVEKATLSTDYVYSNIFNYYNFLTDQQYDLSDDGFLSDSEGYKEFEIKTKECIEILREEREKLKKNIQQLSK